ncbi:MAG: menaquinone biosynthesis family protein [Bacteroidales bacterium]|jgi:1,4-dihydroxy-6-naphthoate synthase
MKLTLGISPCPNDTFIFDALVNKQIKIDDIEIECYFHDIEKLNTLAENNTYDISKLSFGAFLNLTDRYKMLRVGSAMGFGTGPLLIGKHKTSLKSLEGKKIAIPGKKTTAYLLLKLCTDIDFIPVEMIFSEIEDAIIKGEVAAGVIIHESRFTYESKGLHLIHDLGNAWELQTSAPVPLGTIAINNKVDRKYVPIIEDAIQKSIDIAYKRGGISDFVRNHAQEINDEVMQNHINLYVNEYSNYIPDEGLHAVETMFDLAFEKGFIKQKPDSILA